jgi:hypothetical protein
MRSADAARGAAAWPVSKPMFIRVSTVDGAGGWEVEDTVVFAKALKELARRSIVPRGLTGPSTALPSSASKLQSRRRGGEAPRTSTPWRSA